MKCDDLEGLTAAGSSSSNISRAYMLMQQAPKQARLSTEQHAEQVAKILAETIWRLQLRNVPRAKQRVVEEQEKSVDSETGEK